MKHIYNIHKQRAGAIAVLGLAAAIAFPVASRAVAAERSESGESMYDGLSASALSAEETLYLVIWHKDNSHTAFALEEHPKITYDTGNGTMNCLTAGQEVSFSLENVHKYTFESSSDLGNSLEKLSGAAGSFEYAAGALSFCGFAAGSPVAVYSVDGSMMASLRIGADGTLSMTMGDWPRGIYLIKTLTATYKIIKK